MKASAFGDFKLACFALTLLAAPPYHPTPFCAALRAATEQSMLSRHQFGWILTAILAVALAAAPGRRVPGGRSACRREKNSALATARATGSWAGRSPAGEPFEYGPDRLKIFRTPGYPAVLAPLFLVRDEPPVMWGRALSAVLSTAAVAAVAWLAWLLFDQRTALVGGGDRRHLSRGDCSRRVCAQRSAVHAADDAESDFLGTGVDTSAGARCKTARLVVGRGSSGGTGDADAAELAVVFAVCRR